MKDIELERILEEQPLLWLDCFIEDSSKKNHFPVIPYCIAKVLDENKSISVLSTDTINNLLADWGGSDKIFIGNCLIRVISLDRNSIPKEYKRKIINYLKDLLESPIFEKYRRKINFERNSQTYQIENAISDYFNNFINDLIESIGNPSELSELPKYIENLLTKINHKQAKLHLKRFLDYELLKRYRTLLKLVNEYLEGDRINKRQRFNAIISFINEIKNKIRISNKYKKLIPTSYDRLFILTPIEKIENIIKIDFGGVEYNKQSDLVLTIKKKKYPFLKLNTHFNVKVTIQNKGDGYPTYTSLTIKKMDSRIQFPKKIKEITHFDSNSQDIVYEAFLYKKAKSLKVTFELYWVNFDESTEKRDYEFILKGQDENINWEELSTQSPHDLNKITEQRNLLGRTALIDKIKRSFDSTSLGVFYIHGQKRVGKSSIAEVVREIYQKKNSYLCYYMETGDFIPDDEEPRKTLRKLGETICKKFKGLNPKFSTVPIPKFEGGFSEISEFFDKLKEIEPSQKLIIIIDEFDELPKDVFGLGPVGKSFFKTLKALAGRRYIGLILVGGEKMKVVIKNVGQYINTSLPLKVDSFNKENEYHDFVRLVKNPTPDIIYENDAIESLYKFSSGNPFFAKKILISLYTIIIDRRNSVVDVELVTEAFEASLKEDGEPAFSHFWSDGIIAEKVEEEDITKMNRVKCLLCFSTLLIKKGKVTQAELKASLNSQGIESFEADKFINEFIDRDIFYFRNQIEIDIKNQYFKSWLINYGIDQISSSFSNPDEIEKFKKKELEVQVSASEILEIKNKFGLYNGKEVSADHVRSWLTQFGGAYRQRLIMPLLEGVKFFDQAKIEEACEVLFKRIQRWYLSKFPDIESDLAGEKMTKRIASKLTISVLDNIGKSGSGIARTFTNRNSIFQYQRIDKHKLMFEPNDIIIFIDDFIATGNTMKEKLREVLNSERNKTKEIQSKIFLCSIVGYSKSGVMLEKEFKELDVSVEIANELNESDKCFSDASPLFRSKLEKEKCKELCLDKGLELENKNPLGFSNCQSLIVFSDNCPNNTLPIFYKKTKKWTPLFERR